MISKKARFGILLAVATAPFMSSWDISKPEDPKLIKGKLKNGLTYYIYPNEFPKNEAVYRLFVKTGSLVENDNQKGLAHFLEHMAFNGTNTFPNESLVKYLESNGAKFGKDVNAHTSYSETVYKLQLPTTNRDFVDKTMTILQDWAGGLSLDSTEIEQERGVIMSEWFSTKKGSEVVQQAFLSKLLNGSRFENRKVIGDTTVIQNFKRDEIVDYYTKWYDPKFMAVAVVGDVSVADIEKLIDEKFALLKTNKKTKLPVYSIDGYKKRSFEKVLDPAGTKSELNLIQLFDVDGPTNSEKAYANYLQRYFLNQLIKRRLANLTFQNPSYKDASLQFSGFLNTKKVGLGAVTINPEKVDESIVDFARHLQQMVQHGFLASEIETVKVSYEKALQRKLESKTPTSSLTIMEDIYADFYKGQQKISIDAEYGWYKANAHKITEKSLKKELQRLMKFNKIQYLLTSYPQIDAKLPSENRIYTIFDSLNNTIVDKYQQDIKKHDSLLETIPTAGTIINTTTAPAIKATIYELSNGVKVIVKDAEVKGSKLTISAFREGGMYALDSSDYVTAQYATNVLALSGAGKLTRESLSQYLNGKSASVRFLIDKTRAGVAGSADNNQLETLFQLLYLRWTSPNVDSTNFALIKEKAKEAYRTAVKTDVQEFQRGLGELLVGNDYTTREMTEAIIENELNEDRVLPVFNQVYGNANGYTFVITSDVDKERLENLICTYLGGLPSGEVKTQYTYTRPAVKEQVIRVQGEVGDSPKATVSLISQKSVIDEPSEIYNLKSEILAAIIRMKLQAKLREKMGMIYSASVSASSIAVPSPLSRQSISFNCDPKNVDVLIEAAKAELVSIANDPTYFTKELIDIKTNQLKEMEINKQKDSYWSSYIRNTLFNGIDNWNYVTNFTEIVNGIQAEDLSALCQGDYLDAKLKVEAVVLPKKTSK